LVPRTAATLLLLVTRPASAPARKPALSSLKMRPVRLGSVLPWNWSTPMKLTFGLSVAALVVASPSAKPTVRMTSKFWSVNVLMLVA
jgi:hypothetical protein